MRLNQVTVPLVDYDASVAFYRALGLKLIVASPPRYARFECPDGDGGEPATFSIEKVEGWSGGAWPEVFFEVDDIDAEVARLRSAGIAISDVIDQPWSWREAELRDPAGTRIKLYQAGANRRFPPWRLG
jgi:catechol 2,3-dioxygenase-like lactoylglutathione lyase family enzyme